MNTQRHSIARLQTAKAGLKLTRHLSYTISEEALEEAVATSPIENTRTELLCQWIDSLSSPWPHGVLEDTSDSTLTIPIGGYTVFAFDVSPSRRNASLVAGQILPDGRIGVGILQTWESQVSVDDLKIAAEIKAWADQYRPKMICFDKYTAQSIADRLANAGQITQDVSGAAVLSGLQTCSMPLNSQSSSFRPRELDSADEQLRS
jgi:hypothetical protein